MSATYVETNIGQFRELLKADKGWFETDPNAHEYVFGYKVVSQPEIEIKVATAINKNNGHGRRKGKDAIRVWAIGTLDGRTFGLVKSKVTKRTKGWQGRVEKNVIEAIKMAKANFAPISQKR
jgi:hypothetical protein